jgi:hypothetical protein
MQGIQPLEDAIENSTLEVLRKNTLHQAAVQSNQQLAVR